MLWKLYLWYILYDKENPPKPKVSVLRNKRESLVGTGAFWPVPWLKPQQETQHAASIDTLNLVFAFSEMSNTVCFSPVSNPKPALFWCLLWITSSQMNHPRNGRMFRRAYAVVFVWFWVPTVETLPLLVLLFHLHEICEEGSGRGGNNERMETERWERGGRGACGRGSKEDTEGRIWGDYHHVSVQR